MIGVDIEATRKLLINGQRINQRKLDEYRELKITKSMVPSANGSAEVKLGNTHVIAGVKIEMGEPFSDSPNEGVLMVAAEYIPFASPEFESGPPGEQPIETSRVVDRAIRESKAIDFKKLCIKEGEKVWMIYVDIDVLNNDGNIIDACSIAAAAALKDAKIPEIVDDKADNENAKEHLDMSGIPISVTVLKVGNSIIVDPNKSEYESLDARLTIGTIDTKDGIKLCSMQKGGSHGFSMDELEKIIDIAIEKSEIIRQKI